MFLESKNIIITGADGFIGKNLTAFIKSYTNWEVSAVSRKTKSSDLEAFVANADLLVHLAGCNRSEKEEQFIEDNVSFTHRILEIVSRANKKIPVFFSSSTQAGNSSNYGQSKLKAEILLKNFEKMYGLNVSIIRLPNVFGKWCKPNYNSVVATFCFNLINDIDLEIHNSDSNLSLLYIDDLCAYLLKLANEHLRYSRKRDNIELGPIYKVSVGELADILQTFKLNRNFGFVDEVGVGLKRALYSTYLSFLTPEHWKTNLNVSGDDRGDFLEFLKTSHCGQLSYFTMFPGVVRGQHYHHSKNEKFLVLNGMVKFHFKSLETAETYEVIVNGDEKTVVETVPGWWHSIENICDEKVHVMLWANEIFDGEYPDTFQAF